MKSININEFVRGQLSEKGKYIFIHQYDYIFPDVEWQKLQESQTAKIDKNGFVEMQLWELMNLFGSHMYMGCTPPFEQLNLFFKDEGLEDVKDE